jgi:hypothetical protein
MYLTFTSRPVGVFLSSRVLKLVYGQVGVPFDRPIWFRALKIKFINNQEVLKMGVRWRENGEKHGKLSCWESIPRSPTNRAVPAVWCLNSCISNHPITFSSYLLSSDSSAWLPAVFGWSQHTRDKLSERRKQYGQFSRLRSDMSNPRHQ